MANTTITNLPNGQTTTGNEFIVLDQSGETRKLLLSDLFQTNGSERLTSLSLSNGILAYEDEEGVTSNLDILNNVLIDSDQIADGAVKTAEIYNGAVTTLKIADSTSVSTGVTSSKIANGAVTTLKIADSTSVNTGVTSSKIANGAVTPAKLSLGAPAWDETGSVNAGGITISGHLSPTLSDADEGQVVPRTSFANDATNLWLKGNSAGVSGIFFESDEDGSDINRESDGAYIQYHARGINNSPYSNTEERGDLIIGIANDDSEGGTIGAEDKIIFNIPGRNQLVTTYDAGVTEHKIWHAGNDGANSGLDADLLDGKDGSLYVTTDTDVIDDDTMATASNTTLATSESIKAYVDSTVATAGGFTPSTYAGGESVTLPNGLIMKTGFFSDENGGENRAVNYGSAFPNATISVQLTQVGGITTSTSNMRVMTYSASGFTMYVNTGADVLGSFWTAIGY